MKFDIKKLTPAKVKIVKNNFGFGLVVCSPLKKGDFVVEYIGKKVTADEADKIGGMYLFELNSKSTIDGKSRKNIARYINHSCRPNCEVEIKEDRVFIFTTKKIEKGEELGYDYGKAFFKEYIKPKGCKCGAKKHLYR